MMYKNKAVFLDRDGVINKELGRHIFTPSEFEILPGVISGLKKLQDAGYLIIIITNQSGLAQGFYDEIALNKMHKRLNLALSKKGVSLSAIYFCPHHPTKSLCICRKPDSLLLEKGIARFNIDPSQSWMIGDKQRDVDAATKVGVKGVLVQANENFENHLQYILTML